MRRQDFHYELPDELIAHHPAANRTASRLLVLDGESGNLQHRQFVDVLDLVAPGDVMVFNDTRVIPARVFGQKESGGKVEVLVERVLDRHQVLAHVRSSKAPRVNTAIILEGGTTITVTARREDLFELKFPDGSPALSVLESIGHTPLPPYIDRPDAEADRERYQTVYGKHPGAVAAPTAGLHFDDVLMEKLREKGVKIAFVTLHVGAGTFQPVRAEDIREHKMHSELMEVSEEVCNLIKHAKQAGKRVVAVGTTSVRCLETATGNGEISPFQGETNIFIYPSYKYKTVDALITNFHLPESTLLMLVAAFAGYRHTMNAYREAVANKYRFYSYGDAMFISRNNHVDNGRQARQ